MPPRAATDLQPVTYTDFTAGLWERGNDRECPPNGLLECTDCYPLAAGGLRAGPHWEHLGVTNLPTDKTIVGFRPARDGTTAINAAQDQRTAAVTQWTMMLANTMVFAQTTNYSTYERWIAKGLSTQNLSWSSAAGTFTGVKVLNPVSFVPHLSTLSNSWYFNLGPGGTTAISTAPGIHRITGQLATTVSSTRVLVSNNGVAAMTGHQDRLVYSLISGRYYDALNFTAPGTDPGTGGNIRLVPNAVGDIMALSPAFPDDLLVLKTGQGVVDVQGDVASAAVRQAIPLRTSGHFCWPVRLPDGIVFLTDSDGAWLWPGGGDAIHISPQFVGSPMTRLMLRAGAYSWPSFLGQLAAIGDWLFTPTGYVWNRKLRSWWRTTLPDVATVDYPFWYGDASADPYQILGAGTPAAGGPVRIIRAVVDESRMTRVGSYVATLPLIDMAERDVEIRRIEVFGQGFGEGGTWQITVTRDTGVTEVLPTRDVAARADSARWDVASSGDWLKVRIFSVGAADATSPTGRSEAPMISRIVVWTRPRHTRPS